MTEKKEQKYKEQFDTKKSKVDALRKKYLLETKRLLTLQSQYAVEKLKDYKDPLYIYHYNKHRLVEPIGAPEYNPIMGSIDSLKIRVIEKPNNKKLTVFLYDILYYDNITNSYKRVLYKQEDKFLKLL